MDSTEGRGFLKQVYGKGSLLYQQNLSVWLLDNLKESPEKIGGEGRFKCTYFDGNEVGGAINENERLSDADPENPQKPFILPKMNYWPIEVTGRLQRISRGNELAFATGLTAAVKNALIRMKSDHNRQCYGDATGTLTQVNGAVVASQIIIVDNVQYLRKGQHLDIFQTLGGVKQASDVKITAITINTNTITVDKVVTVSDNAVIVKTAVQDNVPAGSDGKELTGLARIVDTTTTGVNFQGLDRSVFTDFQSNVINAGGALPSNALLEQLLTRIDIVGGVQPTHFLSRRPVYSSFVLSALPSQRFQDDKIKTGYKQAEYTHNGFKWHLDKDCQANTIYALSMQVEHLAKYVVQEPDLADLDTEGQKFGHKQGYDKNYGYYISDMNIGSDKPNAHGKLFNLAEQPF